MEIKFKGQKLSTLEWVESDSILQGKHCNTKRIFLKTSNKLPKWTECKPETVKQVDLFTKEDLEKAWMHGELRKPNKLMHLNNFNEYYKYIHDEQN